MDTDHIALQLYTLRDHTSHDMLGTLRHVATMGYRAVELAGYGNASAQTIRTTLDELGTRVMGGHVALDRLLTQPDATLTEMTLLGCAYVIVPFVGPERRGSIAQAQQLAADLGRCGQLCRDAGLRFCYHNHQFEFAPLDNTTLWDVLLQATDPALVSFELDLFWAQTAGHDPAALIRELGPRAPLLHVKDMTADDTQQDAPVGDGVLAWSDILAAGMAAGVEWYIVEQDNPRDPLNDVRRSLENLRGMQKG